MLWYWKILSDGLFLWKSYNAGLEPCTSFNNQGLEESQKWDIIKLKPRKINVRINAGIFRVVKLMLMKIAILNLRNK